MASKAGTGAKRWPPIAAASVAFILVFVVLPNPLRIPQNNPTAAAEYAPVPGKQDSGENANFGETGLATSGGVGAGGVGEGLIPGAPPPPPPPQYRPRDKNCVGDPPRQTEDQLSPPCVPFFDDDNKGNTWQGVTKKEVKVVLYNAFSVDGDMNTPWKPSDEHPNHQADFNHTYLVRTIKAHVRYFNARFQTYNRLVHVYADSNNSGIASCAEAKGEAGGTYIDYQPFAAIDFTQAGDCYVTELAKEYKVLSFGDQWDVKQKAYEQYPGYVWGFFPSAEVEARWSAEFLCRTLAGQNARFADSPELKNSTRKFGLIWHRSSQSTQAEVNRFQYLSEMLKTYMSRCDNPLKFADAFPLEGDGASEASTVMKRFKDQGITTVVCYCTPYPPGQSAVTFIEGAASQLNYFPEWFWDHGSRMFRAIWNQESSDRQQADQHLGVTHFFRGKALEEQQHYQAYLEMEPGTRPSTRWNFDVYYLFLNLFSGIQAAGPDLTPDTVKQGMFTFHYLQRQNPYLPTGGYGSDYHPKATSDYTFIDTGMAWWWDPDGTPPGGQDGEGCLRVMNEGLRYFAKEWPKSDAALFADGAPCSQDNTEIRDPTGDT